MISLLVAASENNAIGRDGKLLWSLPNDMRFFKNTTWGMVVIMGRKSFEAMGKPLPGRINIVITRNPNWQAEGAIRVSSLPEAYKEAEKANTKEIFVIGGGEIYKLAMETADRIYITRVHAQFKDADAFFPGIDEKKWKLTSHHDFETDDKHAYSYSFQVWDKRTT